MRLLKTLDFTELEWMIKIYDIQNRAKYKKQLLCERIEKSLNLKTRFIYKRLYWQRH